jgi:hypothetical protein
LTPNSAARAIVASHPAPRSNLAASTPGSCALPAGLENPHAIGISLWMDFLVATPEDERQDLKPDDLVDQRSGAAADEQKQNEPKHGRKILRSRIEIARAYISSTLS